MKIFFKTHRQIVLSFVAVLLAGGAIVGAYSWRSAKAKAQAAQLIGGTVSTAIYCCNGIEFIVGPPNSGDFFYDYSAELYSNYQVYDGHGQWFLGTAVPGATCLDIASECDDSRDISGGIIQILGTSM